METKLLKPTDEAINLASELIKNGEVVGVPTETVYGLAGDSTNSDAIKKIFKAKGRPSDNPLIVHISDMKMLDENRRISTSNMIYLGDGFTDIPSMKLTRENGGYAIAVYQNDDKRVAHDLLLDNRIDFYANANYQENSEIDKLIKSILNEISIKSELNNLHKKQMNELENKTI